jgi:tetratricopeptide (TPR) repeat protein
MAFGAFARAIDKDPAQPPARAIRCTEMLAARGGSQQAKALLGKVRSQWDASMSDTDKRKCLKLQARFAMSAGAGDDETAKVLEEVIELDPLDGEALMLLAQHHSKGGRPDQAILYYERAARIDAFAAPAKVKIAQVYVSQGRFADALPLLRDAQSIRPREDVARYLEQVERASKSKR